MSTCEVGIVGGGVQGASIAYHLGRTGVRTTLFEAGTLAGGPTGRSSAICRAVYTHPFLARTARASMDMFADFEALTSGGSCEFVQVGMLFLYGPGDAGAVPALVQSLGDAGVAVTAVAPDALAADRPELDLGGVGAAVWEPGAGYADPSGTTVGLAKQAERDGVELRLGTRVTAIEPRAGGGAVLVDDAGGRTECEAVVIAAGPWTAPLARLVGSELPLTIERHIVATFAWDGEAAVPYMIGDVPGGYYLKPEGLGQLGLGSLVAEPQVAPDALVEEVGDDEVLDLAAPAIERVPAVATARSTGGWGALYDVSPDWQPVIGAIAEGVYVAAGTSGHGFKLAPALGAEIAALVTGGNPDPALADFTPDRFASGIALAAGFGDARILG